MKKPSKSDADGLGDSCDSQFDVGNVAGNVWVDRTSSSIDTDLSKIVYFSKKNTFVIIADDGKIHTGSDGSDGINWSNINSGVTNSIRV